MRRPLVAAAVLAATAALAGCGGGDDDEPEPAPRAQAPVLKVAWTADPGDLWSPPPNDVQPWAWTTDEALIVPQANALTAYAAATGDEQWTVDLPRPVCAISDGPNEDGIAAVLLAGGPATVDTEACGFAAAIDTRTGELLWTSSLRGTSTYGMTTVQAGPEAVTVTNPCDRGVALAIDDGRRLAALPDREGPEACLHAFAGDGRLLVEGASEDADAVNGYDATTGRRLWSVPIASEDARPEVSRVVLGGERPVVEAELGGNRFLYRVDPRAQTLTPIGRESDRSWVPVFTEVLDGRVVIQYGQSRELFALDPEGAEDADGTRTVLAADERAFGARDGLVVSAGASGPTLEQATMTVRSTDPATGARQVLGTVPLDGVDAALGQGTAFDLALAGDTMVVRTLEGLTAYRLPASGPDERALAAPAEVGPGELTPEEAVGLCNGVTAATKRALRFADPALPSPANCEWVENVPGGGTRILRITTGAMLPADGISAEARAERNVAQLRRADEVNHLPALEPVAGLGDEAFAQTSRKATFRLARVVVREGNVVILVGVTGDGVADRSSELRLAERGARLAAADVVAEVQRRR